MVVVFVSVDLRRLGGGGHGVHGSLESQFVVLFGALSLVAAVSAAARVAQIAGLNLANVIGLI